MNTRLIDRWFEDEEGNLVHKWGVHEIEEFPSVDGFTVRTLSHGIDADTDQPVEWVELLRPIPTEEIVFGVGTDDDSSHPTISEWVSGIQDNLCTIEDVPARQRQAAEDLLASKIDHREAQP